MSNVVLAFKQAPSATLDLLVARPELAIVFWMDPDYVAATPPPFVVWLSRLLAGSVRPMKTPEVPAELARNGEVLRLDRSADRVLAAAGDPPLDRLGRAIRGSDHGRGDDRAIAPAEVAGLAAGLTRRPAAAGDPDLNRDFDRLREFVHATLAESLGLVLKIC